MAKIKEILNRINSVKSTQQITQAMKMVAAAKLSKARESALQMRAYTERLNKMMDKVVHNNKKQQASPYAAVRKIKKELVVVITSDRGLCGPFNTSLLKYISRYLKEKAPENVNKLDVLVIGKKAEDYFKGQPWKFTNEYVNLLHPINFNASCEAATFILDSFLSGTYDKVELLYNFAENVASQVPHVEPFLPLVKTDDLVEKPHEKKDQGIDYIYEPSKEEIFEAIIPKALKIRFFKALLESNVAEQSARMVAMTKATDNAEELLKDLRLTYNRTRQAGITKEILEIVGGAEALSGGH